MSIIYSNSCITIMLLLFDPLAEQPLQSAAFVKRSSRRYAQNGVDGQKRQRVAGFKVLSEQVVRTPDEQVYQDASIVPFADIFRHRTSARRAKSHAIQLRLIEQTCSDAAQTPAGGRLRD